MARVLLLVPAVVVVLAAGLWFWSGVVVDGYEASIVAGVLWFVAVGAVLGRLTRRAPSVVRRTGRATVLACSLAAAVAFWATSVRETVVDEQVVTGVTAAGAVDDELFALRRGTLPGGGRAELVEDLDGRRLVRVQGLRVDDGARVRVLAEGQEAGAQAIVVRGGTGTAPVRAAVRIAAARRIEVRDVASGRSLGVAVFADPG